MTNVNQTNRPGNIFGTPFGAGFGNNGIEYALKPGFIVKALNNFYVIEAREALTVDLFFSEAHTVGAGSNLVNDATLTPYGAASITALLDPDNGGSFSAGTYTASLLSPAYDSGYIKFDDLEPAFGHLYQLCPTLPFQPKFIDGSSGNFLSTASASLPSSGSGRPIGFTVSDGAAAIGTVFLQLYIKHPWPPSMCDQAPEGDSGSAAVGSLRS